MDQCFAHPRDTTALKNIKVIFLAPNCTSHLQPLDMAIIHTFKCQYSKQLVQKAVAVIDGELLGDAGSCDDEDKQGEKVEEELVEKHSTFV